MYDVPYIYVLLYVDDMLIAIRNMVEINDLKTLLENEFGMEDLGATKNILWIIFEDIKE